MITLKTGTKEKSCTIYFRLFDHVLKTKNNLHLDFPGALNGYSVSSISVPFRTALSVSFKKKQGSIKEWKNQGIVEGGRNNVGLRLGL